MNRPLKIVQVTDLFEPFVGGMEQHVATLSHGLAQRGHDVTVVTARLPGTAGAESTGACRVKRITGWYGRVPAGWYAPGDTPCHPPVPDPGVVAALRAVIGRARPDVVHAQGWLADACLALARARRPALVVTLHDHGHACPRKTLLRDGRSLCPGPRLGACLRCAPGQYGKLKGAAVTMGLRAVRPLHDRADCWVAVSRFVADASHRVLPPGRAVTVIPPASGQPPAAGRRPSWLPAGGYLLFVGALSRHKGLHWLLDAYASGGFSRPLLVIGSPRRDSPRTWPAGVVVRTSVPHGQVMQAWRHAFAGLVPSLWPEPFGLTAVEAMRSQVPVIATRIGALPGLVSDGVTGLLVEPGDTAALQAAIRRLDSEPPLHQAMGAAAAAHAKQFSPSVVITRHEELYRRVLADRQQAAWDRATPARGEKP